MNNKKYGTFYNFTNIKKKEIIFFIYEIYIKILNY